MLAEAEVDKKQDVLAQTLTARDKELLEQREETRKLKVKLRAAKKELERKDEQMAEKVRAKQGELEELRLQMSEGEVEKLLRICDRKDALVRELRSENQKLGELKAHYEQILEKYEADARELRARVRELDRGEEVRSLGQEMDVLKMKMLFYEGRQEKVNLADLAGQMEDLEQKLKEAKRSEPQQAANGTAFAE